MGHRSEPFLDLLRVLWCPQNVGGDGSKPARVSSRTLPPPASEEATRLPEATAGARQALRNLQRPLERIAEEHVAFHELTNCHPKTGLEHRLKSLWETSTALLEVSSSCEVPLGPSAGEDLEARGAGIWNFKSQDLCPFCKLALRLDVVLSMHICCSCGRSFDFIDSCTTVLVFSEASYNFTSSATRRTNHFDAWIAALQGKERLEQRRPVGQILEQVMNQLRSSQVSPEQVNVSTVQAALRKLRLRKYYDQVQNITALLTGHRLPRLSLEEEMHVKLLFNAASSSFQHNAPESRRNMIAYSVVLHSICIFLGLEHFKHSFVPMRSQDKLNKQAQYMLRICLDLGWNYNILREQLFMSSRVVAEQDAERNSSLGPLELSLLRKRRIEPVDSESEDEVVHPKRGRRSA